MKEPTKRSAVDFLFPNPIERRWFVFGPEGAESIHVYIEVNGSTAELEAMGIKFRPATRENLYNATISVEDFLPVGRLPSVVRVTPMARGGVKFPSVGSVSSPYAPELDTSTANVASLDEACAPPQITNLQNGDTLHASYCDNLTFQMLADPGGTCCGCTITGWSVISGVGAIDANGNYQFQGTHDSVYAVIVEVTNDCPSTASISFYVRTPTEMVVPRYQDGLGEHPFIRKLHGVFEKDGVEYVRVWIETDGTNPNFQQDMEEIGVKVEESSVAKNSWYAEIRVDQFQTIPTVPSVIIVSPIVPGRESESTGSLLSPTGPMQDSAE